MQLKKVGSFLKEKQPGHKVKCPISSNVEVKNKWSNASTTPYVFMALTGRNYHYVGCHTMFDW